MSTTTLSQSAASRERTIAKRYAHPNEERIRVLVRDGFMREDAEEIDRLERLENSLLDAEVSVGLSEQRRARLNTIQAELDRFMQAARCHAEKQAERKPITEGRWTTEKQDDGSTWIIGTDPKPGVDREVCVAAFEMAQDAKYVAQIHNQREASR
jgi:hypothetical protein